MNGTRAILVMFALTSLPAFADDPASSPTPAAKTPANKAAKKAVPKTGAGAANMVVTKDAETGELRPATAAEREKLLGRRPLAAPEHKVVTLPDGSVMVELGEADMSYAVATKASDGTIRRTCVHGAPKAATTGNPATAPAPKPVDR